MFTVVISTELTHKGGCEDTNESILTKHLAQNPAHDKCSVNVLIAALGTQEERAALPPWELLSSEKLSEHLREGGKWSLSRGNNLLCLLLDDVLNILTLSFCICKVWMRIQAILIIHGSIFANLPTH